MNDECSDPIDRRSRSLACIPVTRSPAYGGISTRSDFEVYRIECLDRKADDTCARSSSSRTKCTQRSGTSSCTQRDIEIRPQRNDIVNPRAEDLRRDGRWRWRWQWGYRSSTVASVYVVIDHGDIASTVTTSSSIESDTIIGIAALPPTRFRGHPFIFDHREHDIVIVVGCGMDGLSHFQEEKGYQYDTDTPSHHFYKLYKLFFVFLLFLLRS